MAGYSWNSNSSGSWADAADWGGVVPTLDDTAFIAVPNITVSVGTGVLAQAYSLQTLSSELLVDGGTLQTAANAIIDGAFVETSGLFIAGGQGVTFDQSIYLETGAIKTQAGGVINIDGGGTLAGTLSGYGTVVFDGGSTYLNTGFVDTLKSFYVTNGGKVGVQLNLTLAGSVEVLQNSVLDLFGHTLTTTGNVEIDGTVDGGALTQTSGTIVLGSPVVQTTYLDNSLVVVVNKLLEQDGNVSYGVADDSGAKLTVGKTGVYQINGNWGLGDPSSTGSIVNQGAFVKAGGGKTAEVYASFTSSNTVKVQTGILLFDGIYNTLSGTVSGAGTLGIAGDQTNLSAGLALTVGALVQQSGLVVLNNSLTYHNEWDMTGGVLNLNNSNTTLTLSNSSTGGATSHFNFDNGLIAGYGGTIVIDGVADFGGQPGSSATIGGLTTLTINGVVDQTYNIIFGASSNPSATIAAGGVWQLEGDSSIDGYFGEITNNGSFIDNNGSEIAVLQSTFVNNGTLTINNSALQLAGEAALSGVIDGNGILDIRGGVSISGGATVTVASLNIDNGTLLITGDVADAMGFSQLGNAATLIVEDGATLTLSGTTSLDSGTLSAGGALILAGPTELGFLQIGGTVEVTGTAEQTSNISFAGGTLEIAAGATYKLADDVVISSQLAGDGAIANAGDLIALGTGSGDNINAIFDQTQTGVLNVYSADLSFSAGGQLSGSITGTGTVALIAGTYTLGESSALSLTVASFEVLQNTALSLAANQSYAGYWDETSSNSTLNLNTLTLSLSGTTQLYNVTLDDSGAVTTTNSTTLSGIAINGSTLNLAGSAEQIGQINLTNGILDITKSGVYAIEAGSSIAGTGTVDVVGTLSAAGDGLASLESATVDTGLISVALGTLSISNAITGTGSLSIGGTGAFLDFTNLGTIGASNTIGFTASGGDLYIGNALNFAAVINDFAHGDTIELPGFGSTTTGTLSSNGLTYTVSDKGGNAIALVFKTAEAAGSISIGTSTADGNIIVLHS
jgi:hypothetical protein